MRRGLEAGYGSPQCPEIVGTAQKALEAAEERPHVDLPRQFGGQYVVYAEHLAESLEGAMYTSGYADINNGQTKESAFLHAYREAYSHEPAVASLRSVYNTGMVPENSGVELEFTTGEGTSFTSTGSSVETAFRDGVAFQLLPKEE